MTNLPITITGKHHNMYNLFVTVKINNHVLSTVDDHGNININFEYDESQVARHNFELVVTGKIDLLNSLGNCSTIKNQAVNAAYIIDSIKFGEYNAIPIITTSAKYHHTQNNNAKEYIIEDYTNWLGYDGVVKFTFVTPLFAWFLSDFEY